MKTLPVRMRSLLVAACLVARSWAGSPDQPSRVVATFDSLPTAVAVRGPREAKVRLVTDNAEAWWVRWSALASATRSIDLTYYIVDDDVFGRSLMGLLLRKAKDGVRIRFMVDARGSPDLARRLRSQGLLRELARYPNVAVRVFNPYHRALLALPKSLKAVINANHDKLILVDGRLAVTGGRNIGWHYFAGPSDRPHTFRDADVLLEGEAVAAEVERAFGEEFECLKAFPIKPASGAGSAAVELELARMAMELHGAGAELGPDRGGTLPGEAGRLREELAGFPSLKGGGAALGRDLWQGRRAYPVKVLDKHGFGRPRDDATGGMLALFEAAERSIVIQNPYVVMTKGVFETLQRAGKRGVAITLLTNGPTTSNLPITQAFFLRDWKKLLRDIPNLRLLAMQGERTLHAKTFVIDGEIACVGSYNLDPMSEGINSEVITLVRSPEFAKRLELWIEAEAREAVEYRIEVDGNGIMRTVRGPEEELSGRAGILIKLLGRLPFLRSLV